MNQTPYDKLIRWSLLVAGMLRVQGALAVTYNIRNSQNDNPPCSGSLHTCSGRVNLQAGGVVASSPPVTLGLHVNRVSQYHRTDVFR